MATMKPSMLIAVGALVFTVWGVHIGDDRFLQEVPAVKETFPASLLDEDDIAAINETSAMVTRPMPQRKGKARIYAMINPVIWITNGVIVMWDAISDANRDACVALFNVIAATPQLFSNPSQFVKDHKDDFKAILKPFKMAAKTVGYGLTIAGLVGITGITSAVGMPLAAMVAGYSIFHACAEASIDFAAEDKDERNWGKFFGKIAFTAVVEGTFAMIGLRESQGGWAQWFKESGGEGLQFTAKYIFGQLKFLCMTVSEGLGWGDDKPGEVVTDQVIRFERKAMDKMMLTEEQERLTRMLQAAQGNETSEWSSDNDQVTSLNEARKQFMQSSVDFLPCAYGGSLASRLSSEIDKKIAESMEAWVKAGVPEPGCDDTTLTGCKGYCQECQAQFK